jgi:hypothetical protein
MSSQRNALSRPGVERRARNQSAPLGSPARLGAALSIGLVLVGVAGCTRKTSHVAASSTNSSSALVVRAWRNTLAQESARLSFDVIDSSSAASTETGVVDFAHAELELKHVTADGTTSEIRVVGGSTYLGQSNELPASLASALASGLSPGATLAAPSAGSAAISWITQRAAAGEELLGALGEPLLWDSTALNALVNAGAGPRKAGLTDIRGTATTEYIVTPVGPYSAVDFYVDNTNLVRRLHLHLRVPSHPAATPSPATAHEEVDETLELYAFGVTVHVLAPANSTAG